MARFYVTRESQAETMVHRCAPVPMAHICKQMVRYKCRRIVLLHFSWECKVGKKLQNAI